ncbi:hypothetical protein Bca4012_033248 [Brassica carinata]
MALLSASSDDETHSLHLTLPDFSLYRVARAAPVTNAAVAYSTFESLRLGRAAQSVVARLIRFWDSLARVAHIYKITEHQFLIRFIASTLQTDAPVIKFDKFMVRHYDHLQVLANTNLELPVHAGIRPQEQCKHEQGGGPLLNRTLKLYSNCFHGRNVSVYLSLWDEAASTKGPQKF